MKGAAPLSTDTVTLFFALLAVVAEASTVAVGALALAGRAGAGGARARDAAFAALGPDAARLALAVAAVCTGGSLYLSEVAHFVPCRLCWYQRAAMYPLVPVLGLAVLAGWRHVHRVALPLAVAGGCVSVWHVLVERFPTLESGACDPANPCSLIWVERFGYLTIPAMALSGFALIVALMFVHRHWVAKEVSER